MPAAQLLSHRTIISVSGADAETFLNGLLTASVSGMAPGAREEMRYGALLTPQGKIIADMLLVNESDKFLIDCDSGASAGLLKRLNMFRLRAKVMIEERADLAAIAFDGASDPRSDLAPRRTIAPRNPASAYSAASDAGEYHAARIAAGLAEQGIDFASEDVFPADINMDLIGGIDFKKGCFVGQEVVSRMKRRGNARRRTLKASIVLDIPTPAPVLAGDFEIGTLTSISGGAALARLRIDRLAEAQAKGEAITANGQPITFDNPPWLGPELAALKEAKTPG
jgi:folate-binding protein YgfZ